MFACNVKSFAIVILVFFLFFFLAAVYGRPAKSFFGNVLWFVFQEACDQGRSNFVDKLKAVSVKIIP